MDTAQWPQEIVVKPIEEIVTNTCGKAGLERKPRPQKEQALNCPRCHSTNTKFCYYNNYSLTQPRYFCKTCRRYWTEGGSLRNIPVGGGSRKNKRSSSNSSAISHSSSKKLPDLVAPPTLPHASTQNPKIHQGAQDLNLAFPAVTPDFRNISELVHRGSNNNINENDKRSSNNNMSASCSSCTSTTTSTATAPTSQSHFSALQLLTEMTSRGGLNSFMPMPVPNPDSVYSTSGFPLQEFKPTLNFSLDGLATAYGSVQDTSGSRLSFPFDDLKQVSSTPTSTIHLNNNNKNQHADSAGYWTGMLGGGSW